MPANLLKQKEIEQFLDISRTTLWRLKKKGLPTIKVGKTNRYNLNDVKKWLANEPQITYNKTDNTISFLDVPAKPIKVEKILNDYKINLRYLFKSNLNYLKKIFNDNLLNELKTSLFNYNDKKLTNQEIVRIFSNEYYKIIHKQYREANIPENYDIKLNQFINEEEKNIKIIWGNASKVLRSMETESIQLMVTSPPYYNAREYSQWDNLNLYLEDMRQIIRESYRVLDNHRVWVFNVGDIFDNDRLKTKSVWGKKRIPLGANFIKIFEEEGFEFVDDIIWDKGEVESKRHMNNGMNYPFYQYPVNCYEHILIFHKHRLDKTIIPCPICGSLKVNGNTQSEIGVQSWECKNPKCFVRSPNNRGKRFSLRTNMMQYQFNGNEHNIIDKRLINQWRRDIVSFPPVIKINSLGKNVLGHSAPFPEDIPEMSVKYFTYAGEKVLDPFAGSFTSAIAAKKLGRVGIGIELNKKMFKSAIIKRIESNFQMFQQEKSYQEIDC